MKYKRKKIKIIILAVLCGVLLVINMGHLTEPYVLSSDIFLPDEPTLKVHFINVGQADSILIQSGKETMLIDAGNNEDSNTIADYLIKLGINKLDYVIATHGHEDHIGGMDDIMEEFPIKYFYMPKQKYQTQSYDEVIQMAAEKGIHILQPQYKEQHAIGTAEFAFITPDEMDDYEDINDSSIGIRLVNGRHSFLMCGDISKNMEQAILDSGVYIRSDVLKISHHGSNDTSSHNFLKRVAPEYAVISCGENNDFGHPHKKTLKTLKKLDIELFRTDEQGTILFISNGRQLTCNRNPILE